MKDLERVITHLKRDYKDSLRGFIEIPSQEARTSSFPGELDKTLQNILEKSNIHSLYSHQFIAFNSITEGKDTLLLSRTASGKTLSFLLPILNDYKKSDKKFTTLLMYPTKAVSPDQESTLGKLLN